MFSTYPNLFILNSYPKFPFPVFKIRFDSILIQKQTYLEARPRRFDFVYIPQKGRSVKFLWRGKSVENSQHRLFYIRTGKTWVLIATDVIARGMDFKGINCVINYDFSDSASAYIHRIGRSGRAGKSGEAITFYTEEDVPFLRNIANMNTSSGCEVPSWIMSLKNKKWKKHRPKCDHISTRPKADKKLIYMCKALTKSKNFPFFSSSKNQFLLDGFRRSVHI